MVRENIREIASNLIAVLLNVLSLEGAISVVVFFPLVVWSTNPGQEIRLMNNSKWRPRCQPTDCHDTGGSSRPPRADLACYKPP